MHLVITIPAFNEEKTIGKVIDEIPRKITGIKKISILVINDGSKDKTAAIARSKGAIVLENPRNMGLAKTFARGMEKALELGADIIANTDADFQYNQKQIPALVQPVLNGQADIVMGSRFEGFIESMPFQKKWGNQLATFATRTISGIPITDGQTGFRAFSREAALRVNIFSRFTYTQETILEAADKRLHVVEIPIDFRKREDGGSRLFGSVFSYARKSGMTLLLGFLNYHPLKFFATLGTVTILVGLVAGARVLVHYTNTGQVSPYLPTALLASLLVLAGIMCLALGFLAEMIKRNRQAQELQLYYTKKSYFNQRSK